MYAYMLIYKTWKLKPETSAICKFFYILLPEKNYIILLQLSIEDI